MLHLHTASIEVRQASPRHRCTLTLLFAHASAHATRFRHRRIMFDQQDGTRTRWRSCCGPLRRHSIVGVVLLQKPGALRRSSQALSWCCNGRDGWYRVAGGGCARGCSWPSMSLACATCFSHTGAAPRQSSQDAWAPAGPHGPDAFCACLHALTHTRSLRVADGTRPSSASRCDLYGGLCSAGAVGARRVDWRSFRWVGDSRVPAVIECWRFE